jgi:hypothetical protein
VTWERSVPDDPSSLGLVHMVLPGLTLPVPGRVEASDQWLVQ